MSVETRTVAAGPGWRVQDVLCSHGPQDPAFEEQHGDVAIAAVTAGSFQYRTRAGDAVLVPGALLLGNAGACFQCGHEHARGDRCLAFHFSPRHFECVAADAGVDAKFSAPSLPPLPQLVPLLAEAEAARDAGDGDAFEELAVRLIGAVARLLASSKQRTHRFSTRDERRITEAVRRIERASDRPITLSALARAADLSPYHFLRSFRAVVGLTPYQFLLRTRLNRAALRLRNSRHAISAIAFEEGFNDLSTFNRRFRRLVGMSPGEYRARA